MKSVFRSIDKTIFIISIILFAIGLVMIGSASYYKLAFFNQNPYLYMIKQGIILIACFFAFFIIIRISIDKYKKMSKLIIIGIIVLLALLSSYGAVINQTTRWFNLGFFSLQPSEFAKTAIILYFAYFYSKNINKDNIIKLFNPLIFVVIIFGFVFKQPDLGTCIIIFCISFLLFVSIPFKREIRKKLNGYMVVAVFVFAISVLIVTSLNLEILKPYQKQRLNFFTPCQRYTETGTGYQVCNGYIAINNGDLFGVGIGDSTQKFLYLPEAHTDFIFPIIMEELGLVVSIIILVAYLALVFRIVYLSKHVNNLAGSIILYGVSLYILMHLIVNLGGVLGIIPLTGAPLLFFSYGGSHTLNLVICLGLVQRVIIEDKTNYNKETLEKGIRE